MHSSPHLLSGIAPAAESYITGFALSDSTDMSYATSIEVAGRIYSADSNGSPSPLAATSMRDAHSQAQAQSNVDFAEFNSGLLDSAHLYPGL